MSFGALSGNAIEALNGGAAKGGFAHDSGEGAISPYHLKHGGDLIWEIGSGYFGCRTADGHFDAEKFREKAALPSVKAISIKLSQGAKPGLGGVLPGPKVTPEIAETRGVPVGQTVVSPPAHTAFPTPLELVHFIATLRSLSGGKPVGFKLCIGARTEFLSICKAMLQTGITPDFIIVDGSEGGTGAAPQEFVDHVGMPLDRGPDDGAELPGRNGPAGARPDRRVRQGHQRFRCRHAHHPGRRLHHRRRAAMMFAVGCIQAMKCHTNRCPTGVATQDPGLARALDVPDKIDRVANFQKAVVASAAQMVASMGLESFSELTPVDAQPPHRLLPQPHLRRDLRVADARRTAGLPAGGLAVGLDRVVRRGIRLSDDPGHLR